ncbi:MAG: undecaprenyl/decaprenyl-phosphate alpha-N-acetylglucosaminyl 1-phosphate transferase [Desulfuromonadales bacterium]|nr:undecaprenyl/decaprenyl-phosphate alpha-N-acetylglucosaminyl 1-phosphate transferase [Desulfuromonadales bacterium]
MNLLSHFYAFMTALCAALIMVPFLRRWALDKGTVDIPDERKVHNTPTPRLGGIAIFLAFLFSALIFAPQSMIFRGVMAGGLVVFATGIADDLHGLKSREKFLGQIVGCLVTIAVGNLWLHDLGDLFGFGSIVLPVWLGVPFTVFAVVGVSNAINLIDGLDGLAGGVSVIALMPFALLGVLGGNPLVSTLAMALAGALLGFLKYNFYPARIFMGDTGSLTVGFVLGFLAVAVTQSEGMHISPMLPVVILGLPLFDAIWVMSSRLFKKMGPFSPDKTHVHHKFLDLGIEHRFTVLVIYTISLIWACSAVVLRDLPEYALLIFLLGTAGCSYLFLRYLLSHRERYSFLGRDDEGPIRNSVLFNRCADLIDRLLPLLSVILMLYALLGVGFVLANGVAVWPVALALCVLGVGMRRWASGGESPLLVVYAAACLLAFVIWQQGESVWFGVSPKRFGDGLLLAAALLVGTKIFFRRAGEFFLGTADFLSLGLMIFLAIAAQQPNLLGISIGGPLLRAILLVLAARTVASRGPAYRRFLVNCTLVLLAVFALAGLK